MKCLGMLRIKEVGLRTIVRYGAHDLEELKRLWGFCYLVPTTQDPEGDPLKHLRRSMPKGLFVAPSG
jgi:hypothetical protein